MAFAEVDVVVTPDMDLDDRSADPAGLDREPAGTVFVGSVGGDGAEARRFARSPRTVTAAVALALGVGVSLAGAPCADAEARVEGGEHARLATARGPVHLWRPAGYDRETATLVVYVHGYWTSADAAWSEHQLARQFRASGRNALFVVPQAPTSKGDSVRWPVLAELLDEVARQLGEPMPAGPVVAVGHSGAFRTIAGWLVDRRLAHVILLDGLYSGGERFGAWLAARAQNRLVLVSADTLGQAADLARGFGGGAPQIARRDRVPGRPCELGAGERDARLLLLQSQYGHMEIVTEGRTMPLLLRVAPIAAEEL